MFYFGNQQGGGGLFGNAVNGLMNQPSLSNQLQGGGNFFQQLMKDRGMYFNPQMPTRSAMPVTQAAPPPIAPILPAANPQYAHPWKDPNFFKNFMQMGGW